MRTFRSEARRLIEQHGMDAPSVVRLGDALAWILFTPACYGKTGWAHWPANGADEAGAFQADDGTQTPCNAQDVTLWWPVVAANAA